MKDKRSGFVKLDHELMDSPAWRTASPRVRCLVLAIWRRHNGANNGKIPYSRREAQHDLGCGSTQAVRYFSEAQEPRLARRRCASRHMAGVTSETRLFAQPRVRDPLTAIWSNSSTGRGQRPRAYRAFSGPARSGRRMAEAADHRHRRN